jgi:hypothetical protein
MEERIFPFVVSAIWQLCSPITRALLLARLDREISERFTDEGMANTAKGLIVYSNDFIVILTGLIVTFVSIVYITVIEMVVIYWLYFFSILFVLVVLFLLTFITRSFNKWVARWHGVPWSKGTLIVFLINLCIISLILFSPYIKARFPSLFIHPCLLV